MAIVDRLIVEIVGDSLGLQNSLSDVDGQISDFEARNSGKMLSLFETLKLSATIMGGIAGTLKVMNDSVERIVEHEARFKRMFNFTNEDIERAERYKGLLSEMLGLTEGVGRDAAARMTNSLLAGSEYMTQQYSGGLLRETLPNWIGNMLAPANAGAITADQITARRMTTNEMPWWLRPGGEESYRRETEGPARFTESFMGMLDDLSSSIAHGIGAGVGSMGEMAGGGLDSARRWMLANQRRGKEMVETIGSTGITLGDTAEGYREMHEQRTQTQVLVDQNKEQTNLLKDIRDNLKREDPFA